mmetsp:Transcript_73865/g.225903  ORF Transcript_73865/g.225903 Transcript_73865/m.225903 type:complete len:253 (+) Transcript_73865:364-1122(+)
MGHDGARLGRVGGVPRPAQRAGAGALRRHRRRQQPGGRRDGGPVGAQDLAVQPGVRHAHRAGHDLRQQLLRANVLGHPVRPGLVRRAPREGPQAQAVVPGVRAPRRGGGAQRGGAPRRVRGLGEPAAVHYGCRHRRRAHHAFVWQPCPRHECRLLHGKGRFPGDGAEGGVRCRGRPRSAVLRALLLRAGPVLPLHPLRRRGRGRAPGAVGCRAGARAVPRGAGGDDQAHPGFGGAARGFAPARAGPRAPRGP